MVWAWDEETGEAALKEVVETYVNETDELVHVFVNGEEIVTTPSHPFYSPVKGWTDAVKLRAGDILVLVNGEYVVVEMVQHEILEAPVPVYNFQVKDYHTYFVTNDGVLVHNLCRNVPTKDLTPTHPLTNNRRQMNELINDIKENGIQNILALRGDIPKDAAFPMPGHYKYACELIEDIKTRGDFCIGAACYPEGHVETEHKADDIAHLKQKVDSGVDFLTSQMFFDNSIFYNFLYRIREKGITVPVLPGIMPVTNGKQMARICKLSGTVLPQRFHAIVDRFGDDPKAMQQAGIAYATDQVIDLIANGVNNIHIYSMNKPEVAAAIMANLSEIVK